MPPRQRSLFGFFGYSAKIKSAHAPDQKARQLPTFTPRTNWITLYVLELEHGCFYVGQSASPEVRLDAHLKGKGAAWTKLHRPVKLVERRPAESKDWKHAEEIENQFTLMMMRKHGWQRVRGGFWTNTSDELTRKNLLHHERHAELAVSNPLPAGESTAPLADVPITRPVPISDSRRPIRSMQRWSEAEDQLLRREYAAERGIDWIAGQHCRTTTAISARLLHLGLAQTPYDSKQVSNRLLVADT